MLVEKRGETREGKEGQKRMRWEDEEVGARRKKRGWRNKEEMGAEDKEREGRRRRMLQIGNAGEKVRCLFSTSP